jgi:DNA-binding NarL/FixJ family response regulator
MVVDDQEMIRMGLRAIVDSHEDLHVVAEAPDGSAAIKTVRSVAVDVVLMDLRMPGVDGVEATRRIREESDGPTPRILVLTTFDEDENVLAALRAGADGFLSKGVGPDELSAAIRNVASGGNALSASAVTALVGHVAANDDGPADPDAVALFAALTPRELEIVEAIVGGKDNAQIGAEFFLSPFTVKTHANRAMTKVGVRDRAQLVSLAFQAGIRP